MATEKKTTKKVTKKAVKKEATVAAAPKEVKEAVKQEAVVVAEPVKVATEIKPAVEDGAIAVDGEQKAPVQRVRGKKEKRVSSVGKVYVTATFNNTIVTVTDTGGNTIAWGSAGASGFKGARKATPYAATTAVEGVAKKVQEMGMREVEVFIKGPGSGRDSAIRALRSAGLMITLISDVTPIPHNGIRARKKRRV